MKLLSEIDYILTCKVPKKQTTKLCLQNFEKLCIMLKTKDYRANTVDPDEMAHYELPLLDLQC